MAKFTPTFAITFETELKGIITGNWQRVGANLYWDKIIKSQHMNGGVEILTWLLETARLVPEGQGGNMRFDDIAATSQTITVSQVGSGLRLTRNEIEDNQLANNHQVGALDYARKWASDIGENAAYYPQQIAFQLIANANQNPNAALAYDGLPFFSTNHPVLPGLSNSQGTYSNVITGVGINPTTDAAVASPNEMDLLIAAQKNFAKALAGVKTQRFVNGVPRYLKVSAVLVPTTLEYRMRQIISGAVLAQTDNILARAPLGGMEVIVAPELDTDPTTYYLIVQDSISDELGGLILCDRQEFELRTYMPQNEAALNRADQFEWTMKGRKSGAYGHPYLFYKCTV